MKRFRNKNNYKSFKARKTQSKKATKLAKKKKNVQPPSYLTMDITCLQDKGTIWTSQLIKMPNMGTWVRGSITLEHS